jgi:formamidopyrimidine-DNA glycosylase
MPELPEVETIKRGLTTHLIGHTIQDIQILDPRRFTGDKSQLIGRRVERIQRRGKGLVIHFDRGISLAIHVKMTGQLIYRSSKTKHILVSPKVGTLPSSYSRVVFHLDQNAHLYYNDVRRFGWLKVINTSDLLTIPFFAMLGPEPFDDFTREYFSKLVSSEKRVIKTVLLDQSKIAGIGNIYANDSLYLARIDPRRTARTLTTLEIQTLYDAVHEVLKFSIEHGAASDTNYVDALGQDGRYQNHFKVYGRAGETCDRCGEIIVRIVVGGRGTFICSKCQK